MNNLFQNNKQSFIQKYFSELPIQPKLIEYNFNFISNLKKDITDLYYNILKKDSLNFNKFFYSLLDYEDSDSHNFVPGNNSILPGIGIWQNKFIRLLNKFNKKPKCLFLFSPSQEYYNVITQIFKNLRIIINDENFIEIIKKEYSIDDLPELKNMMTPKTLDINVYNAPHTSPDDFQNNLILFCVPAGYIFKNEEKKFIIELSGSNRIYFFIFLSATIPNGKLDYTINEILELGFLREICYFIRETEENHPSISCIDSNQMTFLDKVFNYQSIKLDKTNIDEIFLECSNSLKQYADYLISNEEYSIEANFFFLESLRFSKKAIDLRMEYAHELEKKAEWEKVIDELAHSLNTNIGAARDSVHSILLETKDPDISVHSEEAENFMREAAELVDLTLDSLKLEINITNLTNVSLTEIIQKQINTIRKGITTLRFSTNKHLQNVKEMNINFSLDDSIIIQTYSVAANLIIKDLLKNAILNTDQEAPQVSITSNKIDNDTCLLSITNNKLISKEWADWINFDAEGEEIRMSKSRRVGMRVVKRWKPKLRWQIYVSTNEANNSTTTTVTIPIYANK